MRGPWGRAGRLSHLLIDTGSAEVRHDDAGGRHVACRPPASTLFPWKRERQRIRSHAAQALLRRRSTRAAPPTTTRNAAIPPKSMPLAPVRARDPSLSLVVSPPARFSEEESLAFELRLLPLSAPALFSLALFSPALACLSPPACLSLPALALLLLPPLLPPPLFSVVFFSLAFCSVVLSPPACLLPPPLFSEAERSVVFCSVVFCSVL